MSLNVVAACAASLFFIACMVGAGLMDLVTMRIRNALVIALAAAYPVFAAAAGLDLATVGASVAAALVVFAGMFALFQFGWIGGGDAKLAVAVVLWVGAGQAPGFVLHTTLFGGIFALLLLQFRLLPLARVWRAPPWVARLHRRESGMPYAVPMAAAALSILPQTAWMAALR
jgi:prepilin peptidase CpaA